VQPALERPPAHPIVVRKMDFDFSNLDRHWMAGNRTFTHALNGLHLLFPMGERFFIRSVKHYLPAIQDPALKSRVSAFFGQEARHGLEHEAAFAALEAQGLEIQSFLDRYRKVCWGVLEPLAPPILRLSTTVALEHFTAVMAHRSLTTGELDVAQPVMQDLLRWHACEEIEHKSVAFDVFTAVGGRWPVRVLGAVIALGLLMPIWYLAARHLLRQEDISREELKADREEARRLGGDRRYLIGALQDYIRRDFHPDDTDDYHLAAEWLASAGRLER
jgi:uncharacterized protein